VDTSSSVRPSFEPIEHLASTPHETTGPGFVAKNWGVKVMGRSENPKLLRIMPATASPGVISSSSSGTKPGIDQANQAEVLDDLDRIPKWSKRSTLSDSIWHLP